MPVTVLYFIYCEEYLPYGFLFIIIENFPRPECVICGEVPSNGNMKPSILTHRLQTKCNADILKTRFRFRR